MLIKPKRTPWTPCFKFFEAEINRWSSLRLKRQAKRPLLLHPQSSPSSLILPLFIILFQLWNLIVIYFFFILLKSLRLQARRRKKRAPAYYLEKLIFTINFWSECLRVTYEHAGEQKTRRHVQRIWMACENDWPVFIPHDAWGLRWRAFSLSESAWITPLCAATRDRRLGKGSEWQTPEEIGSGFTINLSCAFVSVFPTSVHSLPTASWFEYKHGLSYLFPRRITTTIMW